MGRSLLGMPWGGCADEDAMAMHGGKKKGWGGGFV